MRPFSSVGASFARDIAEETLTYGHENKNQNRKLNRPALTLPLI